MSDTNANVANGGETERESDGGGSTTATRVRRGLDYALLGGLVLLGAFAAIQFYLAADRTINVWVTREYRPPFKMVFNLVVLLVVGIGVSRQVQRLTGSNGSGDESGSDGDADSEVATDGGIDSADASPFVDESTVAEHTDAERGETPPDGAIDHDATVEPADAPTGDRRA
ncbi:hypothetical protein [Salinigranum sp. GCM10025319]|uniref:hypothetical protein n=1 Tax=Salinigranum sp. GCM10025319 TaxID=3252687 RepID=UPI0036116081